MWSFFAVLLALTKCFAKEDCDNVSIGKNADEMEIFDFLTQPCRYDSTARPPSDVGSPLIVTMKAFIYHLRAHSIKNQLDMLALLELQWRDTRLMYSHLNPNISQIIMEKSQFSKGMWIPHTYLTNEKLTAVLGLLRKDNLINILPSGIVLFSVRLKSILRCKAFKSEWFPFDHQHCKLEVNNWRYDSSEVRIEWSERKPVEYKDGLSPVDFYLTSAEVTSGLETYINPNEDCQASWKYNHSSLALSFRFARQSGFYLLDYYFPSIILVMISWVTFWMAPDSAPGRVILGTGSIMAFLLLSWSGSPIPKSTPFKVNDIWEISCTGFILASLSEFAMVNTIDRRESKNVQLKKKSSKYILKYSVAPKKQQRRRISARRHSSCPSSPEIRRKFLNTYNKPKMSTIKELTEGEFSTNLALRMEKLLADEHSAPMIKTIPANPRIIIEEESEEEEEQVQINVRQTAEETHNFFSMTPQEIASWIDRQSRIVFPIAFFAFNLFYWSFLWIPESFMKD
ncbi:ion channel [Nesidiocoris tenuis]|uniref:Ion channel n=2 Tax=Nesidiocoris tenuis TaxID=355587 RepID=A0ABN7B283_9HEMI|nr:ion channel [Nesidiocoris tenuis]